MEIRVRFTGPLRTLAGRSNLALSLGEGATLGDAILALRDGVSSAFAEQVLAPLASGEPSAALLLLNRAIVSEIGALDRPLVDGDVVAFVTPMEGG
jgi:molybdopterin converting factor small subunit